MSGSPPQSLSSHEAHGWPDSGWDEFGGGLLSQRSPVLRRRHARRAPERAGEARLRGKPAIVSNLAERRAACRDHCPRGLQPPSADVAMWRHARGARKCAGEMKDAETRDIGKVGDGDVFSEMLLDVMREHAATLRHPADVVSVSAAE